MQRVLTSAAALLLAAGTANAGDTVAIDTDENGLVTVEEFTAAMNLDPSLFKGWDFDDDDRISQEEFNEAIWAAYDRNADDQLDAEELAAWESDELRFEAVRSGREVSQ